MSTYINILLYASTILYVNKFDRPASICVDLRQSVPISVDGFFAGVERWNTTESFASTYWSCNLVTKSEYLLGLFTSTAEGKLIVYFVTPGTRLTRIETGTIMVVVALVGDCQRRLYRRNRQDLRWMAWGAFGQIAHARTITQI